MKNALISRLLDFNQKNQADVKSSFADSDLSFVDARLNLAEVESSPANAKSSLVEVDSSPANAKLSSVEVESSPANAKSSSVEVDSSPANAKSSSVEVDSVLVNNKSNLAETNPDLVGFRSSLGADVFSSKFELKKKPDSIKKDRSCLLPVIDLILATLADFSAVKIFFKPNQVFVVVDDEVMQVYSLVKELLLSNNLDESALLFVKEQCVRPKMLPVGFVVKLSAQDKRWQSSLLKVSKDCSASKQAVSVLFSLQASIEQQKAQFVEFTPRAICGAVLAVSGIKLRNDVKSEID